MNSRQAGNSLFTIHKGIGLGILAFAIVLSSCKHKQDNTSAKTETVSLLQLIIGKGDNVFRKVSFGADPKTVQAAEKKTPDEKDTNYLSYTLPLDTIQPDSVNEEIDSLNYFTLEYNFDAQKLNEVDETIFLTNDSAAGIVAQRFDNYFTGKYGDGVSASDTKVWSFTNKGKKIKVTLSDQSAEYDYGKLSLVFYCEDY